ncbi:ABC-type glutathione transport system ATPase component [Kitasatospora sp. GP82]|nr:ABC-type glutathione transport system ATPase component [Kitasatospora sp. GP82]
MSCSCRRSGGAVGTSARPTVTACSPLNRGYAAELLAAVDLPADFASRYPHELSGGQRQRVSIARALAAEPDIPLCDEVTSALDADTAAGIMALLTGLRAERGLALALISHDLPLVTDHADTLITLDQGRTTEGAGHAPPVPLPSGDRLRWR